jgi:hypothetical protein
MGTFTWVGGPLDAGASWSSGGSTGTEPGVADFTIFPAGGGVLRGSLTAQTSLFSAGGFSVRRYR